MSYRTICRAPIGVARRDYGAERKTTSSSGKKKKPALDWRVPIFYWRGTLTGKTWQGTWVASEFGLPKLTMTLRRREHVQASSAA